MGLRRNSRKIAIQDRHPEAKPQASLENKGAECFSRGNGEVGKGVIKKSGPLGSTGSSRHSGFPLDEL